MSTKRYQLHRLIAAISSNEEKSKTRVLFEFKMQRVDKTTTANSLVLQGKTLRNLFNPDQMGNKLVGYFSTILDRETNPHWSPVNAILASKIGSKNPPWGKKYMFPFFCCPHLKLPFVNSLSARFADTMQHSLTAQFRTTVINNSTLIHSDQSMPKQPTYAGFPKSTLKFLRDIRKNNSKKWFDSHRDDYDRCYVEAARDFIEAVGPQLEKLAPEIVVEPRINGSIFRINRDIRFSKDKRPYKDHLDFTFWQGEKKSSSSHLFFRISPDGIYIGTGYHPCSKTLKQFRQAVADPATGQQLAGIAKRLRKAGHELQGTHYKRTPRGFTDDGPAAEFLLHNSLCVVAEDKPTCACSPEIVKQCIRHWKSTLPLHRWLISHVNN